MSNMDGENTMRQNSRRLFEVLEKVLGDYGFSPTIAWALRFFLRNPYESLVVVDKEGRVVFLDQGSEKFLRLPRGGAQGKKITEFIPDSYIPKALQTGTPFIGKVVNLNGTRRIGSTYPLIKDGETIGAIGRLIFHSFGEVERLTKEIARLKSEVESLRENQRSQLTATYTFQNTLGVSAALRNAIDMAKKVSTLDTEILILGESGTGKELFAQAIHNFAAPESPFVRVNSPSIPFDLAESELFGYDGGAFTGASPAGKMGKFEIANHGTIFFDEIGCMPLSTQAKLLRILQEKEVERLGSTKVKKLSFRFLAASNIDLKRLVKEGKFREDLYYRIAKATIHIPPLRDRKEDIPIYVDYFLKVINERFGTRFARFSNEALSCLMAYDWPGNIREFINVLEQSILKKWTGEEIPRASLPFEMISHGSSRVSSVSRGLKSRLQEDERNTILEALEKTKGNKRLAAFSLGIPRSTFYNRLKSYRIEV
jgi:transcriptional regulator with PAS, ATPase and Fis domain